MNGLPRGLERLRVLANDVSDVPIVQFSATLPLSVDWWWARWAAYTSFPASTAY